MTCCLKQVQQACVACEGRWAPPRVPSEDQAGRTQPTVLTSRTRRAASGPASPSAPPFRAARPQPHSKAPSFLPSTLNTNPRESSEPWCTPSIICTHSHPLLGPQPGLHRPPSPEAARERWYVSGRLRPAQSCGPGGLFLLLENGLQGHSLPTQQKCRVFPVARLLSEGGN